MKELKYDHASIDRAVQLQLDAANDTIKKLTAVNSSNELRLIAQDEQIRQLSQPRKDINAIHFNIRREYAKMQMEALEERLMTVLPHNMATIEELCRRSGVTLLPHQLCTSFYSGITVISRPCDADFLTSFYEFF